jgi:hypothetical protein
MSVSVYTPDIYLFVLRIIRSDMLSENAQRRHEAKSSDRRILAD